MRRIILAARRRLRVVLPHSHYLSGLLLLYVLTDIVLVLFNRPLRWGWLPEENPAAGGLMYVAAICFGVYRVSYFHPFFQWEYGQWLRSSPWTSARRLPNGPVALLWQDVLLVGFLAVLSLRSDRIDPLKVPFDFLIAYLLMLSLALKMTGHGWASFLVLLSVGGCLRMIDHPQWAAACLVLSYLIGWWGLRRSLQRFREWDLDWWDEKGLADINAGSLQDKARQKQLGWPFEQLSLKPNENQISVQSGLALAVLFGWAAHILMYHKYVGGAGRLVWEYRLLLLFPCQFLVLGRVIAYCSGYWPPISFWGRLFTFRWIIPRYDQVFGAPLLVVLVWAFGSSILASLEVQIITGVPLLLTVMFALTLTMPPSLDDWRLTGGHRVVPRMQNQKSEMVQTQ